MTSDTSVFELGLSVRAANRLCRNLRPSLGALLDTTPSELRRIRHLGIKTAKEIESRLTELGYSLKQEKD